MELKKILMPTDFSDGANTALSQAIALAGRFDAELHLLHVVVMFDEGLHYRDPEFPDVEKVYSRLEEQASAEMKHLLKAQQVKPLQVYETQCRAFEPAPAIVEYAEEHGIDAIVLGTHGRRGLRRFLLGSVAEEVVRTAPCPVMTLRQDATPNAGIGRIVVPFDFSPDSEQTLETAKELAARFDSRIHLVHVMQPPIVAGGVYGMPLPGPTMIDGTLQMQQALAEVVERCEAQAIEAHVLEGSPAWEIVEYASKIEASLIIIGSHGASGIRRILLGSVSERVIRSAPCPVLVLRRPGAEVAEEPAALDSVAKAS